MTETYGRVRAPASPVTTPATIRRATEGKKRVSQRFMVFTLLAVIIVVDQAVKWWAWRHVTGVMINPGGDFLTGPTIGRLYANPVTGALLDLVDFGLVSAAAAILTRRRRPAALTVCGSLMVGGWASNLLDRLGMHYWTAPGSVRGAVDFISIGDQCWNFADLLIIGATPIFLLVTAWLAKRAANRSVANPARRAIRNAPRARVPVVAVAGAALTMTVALGATHHGGLTKPSPPGKTLAGGLGASPSGRQARFLACRSHDSRICAWMRRTRRGSARSGRPFSAAPGRPRMTAMGG